MWKAFKVGGGEEGALEPAPHLKSIEWSDSMKATKKIFPRPGGEELRRLKKGLSANLFRSETFSCFLLENFLFGKLYSTQKGFLFSSPATDEKWTLH